MGEHDQDFVSIPRKTGPQGVPPVARRYRVYDMHGDVIAAERYRISR